MKKGGNDFNESAADLFHLQRYHGAAVLVEFGLEVVILKEGLLDTGFSLPSEFVVGLVVVVVGSLHSVLLASYTHCVTCVPFDKVQLMNMNPTRKKPINS